MRWNNADPPFCDLRKTFNYRDGYFAFWLIAISGVVIAVSAVWITSRIQEQISNRIRDSLQTVLTTTKEGLRIWAEDTKSDVAAVAEIPQVRNAILDQLHQTNIERRRRSKALATLRRSISPALNRYSYVDFVVITSDGVQVASGADTEIGENGIAQGNRATLDKVFAGQPALGLPFRSSPAQENKVRMIAAAPVRDASGKTVAALAFVLDPTKNFTRVTRLGRMGNTGETYAFDRQGRMLTESRFENHLLNGGLGEPDASGILITELRDPRGDTTRGFKPAVPRNQQNLTRMAASATRGETDIDMKGYRDYRGVPVVGAWLWDDELGMGLAMEMDFAEANQPVTAVRNLTLVFLAIIGGVITLITSLLHNRFGMEKRVFGYEKAAEARRNVMATVSHDLRNPINSVVLSCSVLMNMLKGSQSKDAGSMQRTIEIIHRAGSRMNRLVNDLLDTTNIELGHLSVEPTECRVEAVIEGLVEMVAPLARQKSLNLVYAVSSNIGPINADPQRLIQILSNLLGNAIKFTPEQGTVTLRTKISDGHVEFIVCDTGPGIPADQLPHIFEQYWQGSQRKGGAGLGLFIVKGLVEAHGGRIWIQTTLGQGTDIHFTMPVSAANQSARLSQSQSA